MWFWGIKLGALRDKVSLRRNNKKLLWMLNAPTHAGIGTQSVSSLKML